MSSKSIPGLELVASRLSGSALVRDYLAGEPRAAELYAGHPGDIRAYARKWEEVSARIGPASRRAIAAAIGATTQAAARKLERVLDGGGALVTTGQQTGLFGGPLYTVYKILTAVRLAERLESELGIPVAPMFWVASDDHDWAEVNHTEVIDATNELRRAELPDDGVPRPMSVRALPDEVDAVRESFIEWLPDTEFLPPIAELLRSAYRPGESVARAFAALVRGLFADVNLLVLDPAHPAFKAASAPLIERELDGTIEHARLLEARAAELEGHDYHTQVAIAAQAANVLLDDAEGRDRLMRDDGGWLLRRSKRRIPDAELRALLAAEPARFSPNVLLRPVIESALLPTLSYVGGPGELSYFAQIGPLFEAHGTLPPVAHPRGSLMLIEPKVRKVLDKYELEVADFAQPLHELTARVVRAGMPDDVASALDALRTGAREAWDALAGAAKAIDPTLEGWIASQRNNALAQADSAEKKIASHLKKKNEIMVQQLEKAAVHLYPNGSAQERVLNPLPYLSRHGPELLRAIAETLPLALPARPAAARAIQI